MQRTALFIACIAVGAVALDACGNADLSSARLGPNDAAFADAGAGVAAIETCRQTSDCHALNQLCDLSEGTPGTCRAPSGRCNPELPLDEQCYAGARCDLATESTTGFGSCAFSPPPRSPFPTQRTIGLEQPRADSMLFPTSGFSFQWHPYHDTPGALTVVLVTARPPVFDPLHGQLTNWSDVVWAWSTAEPGASGAADGTVPVRAGHAGVTRAGTLGAPWGRVTLPTGRYWWFAYAIADGSVVASSIAQPFSVGSVPDRPMACTSSAQCVLPSDAPDLFECYANTCRRRCASDDDCYADGTACELTGYVAQTGSIRRGAFCAQTSTTSPADAGVPDAPF